MVAKRVKTESILKFAMLKVGLKNTLNAVIHYSFLSLSLSLSLPLLLSLSLSLLLQTLAKSVALRPRWHQVLLSRIELSKISSYKQQPTRAHVAFHSLYIVIYINIYKYKAQ